MTRADRIRALAGVAGLLKDADLARLAEAGRALRGISAQIEHLDAVMAEARSSTETPDAATLQALDAFARGSALRRLALERALAVARDRQAAARDRAGGSFGRACVLDALAARAGRRGTGRK